jgi:endonuclease/exonuclease/phosphatase family metal-dependent hydrolase
VRQGQKPARAEVNIKGTYGAYQGKPGWKFLYALYAYAYATRQVSDGRVFHFQNTHFDNNQPNQPNSAVLAVERAEPWGAEHPIIFVGDFNSKPDTPAYATLATGIDGKGFHFQNAYDLAGGTYAIVTNQSPEPAYDPSQRIDHIWVAGTAAWTAADWKVDMSVYGPHQYYPSDHFPILCTLKW